MPQHTQNEWVLKFIKTYKLSIFIALGILILSTISVRDVPKLRVANGDKYGHFIAYLTFVSVALFEYSKHIRWSSRFNRWSIVIFLFGVLYGIIMEGLQGLIFVHRNFEPADILANTLGASLGLILFVSIFEWLRQKMKLT